MMNKDLNLEEKDLYELFNKIKIEESEFTTMDEEMPLIQKKRIKKNLNKKIKTNKGLKIFKYGSVAAAISLVSLIGIGLASPAFGENIPILSSITQAINDKFGLHGQYAEYSQMVNKSVTNSGITLTINEVLADDSKLIIGYTIKSEKKITDLEVFILSQFLQINGKMSSSTGGAAGKYMDDCTYVGTQEIVTAIPKGASKFNVDLKVTEIGGIRGHWNFAFSASTKELTQNSAVFKPNMKLNFPDSFATIDKVVLSPIDTNIFISGNSKNKNINSQDDTKSVFSYDYWIAFDDKGIELKPKSLGSGSFNTHTGVFSCTMQYARTKEIPKYITIVPCNITPSVAAGVSVDENGSETPITIETKKPKEISKVIDGTYPFELPQGKMGKLIIKEISTENNRTTVKYTAEGKAPYFQADKLLIKDDAGENLEIRDYNIRKDEQKPNEFTKVFEPLNPNKKYTIYTNDCSNVEFGEDLKFNIPLTK